MRPPWSVPHYRTHSGTGMRPLNGLGHFGLIAWCNGYTQGLGSYCPGRNLYCTVDEHVEVSKESPCGLSI